LLLVALGNSLPSVALSTLCLFLTDPAPPATSTLSLHDALPIFHPTAQSHGLGGRLLEAHAEHQRRAGTDVLVIQVLQGRPELQRSEEHTSELQSRFDLVCRLLLEKKNNDYLVHGKGAALEPPHL